MKVLIVDDERNVRDAIQILIPWEQYEVTAVLEARDVNSAKEIIQSEMPQIIFLDMKLVNQTGTEIMRWVNEEAIKCKIIVVSGYKDFEYVRDAVRYGGSDYLLKPIDRTKLLDAFEKAVKEWKNEESRRLEKQINNIKMNQIQPIFWDKTFSDFMKEPTAKTSIIEGIQEKIQIQLTERNVQVALISLKLVYQPILDKFLSNMDLLYFSILNICNETLSQSSSGYAFRDWNYSQQIGIMFWDNLNPSRRIIEQINEGLQKALGSKFFIVIGGKYEFPHGAAWSYNEARRILTERMNLKRTEQWVLDGSAPNVPGNKRFFINQYEDKFVHAIKNGQRDMVTQVARMFIDELRSLDIVTLEHIEIWYNELQLTYSKRFKQHEYPDPMDFKLLSYLMVDAEGNVKLDDWLGLLEKSFIHFGKALSPKQAEQSNISMDMVMFIKNNYFKDLTLRDFSDHFYLSREYLSRKFKQDFGENLFSYLTNVRIEKACSLLRDTDIKVLEIAQLVGFENEKYFSKVFKNSVGCSPTQYRNREACERIEQMLNEG